MHNRIHPASGARNAAARHFGTRRLTGVPFCAGLALLTASCSDDPRAEPDLPPASTYMPPAMSNPPENPSPPAAESPMPSASEATTDPVSEAPMDVVPLDPAPAANDESGEAGGDNPPADDTSDDASEPPGGTPPGDTPPGGETEPPPPADMEPPDPDPPPPEPPAFAPCPSDGSPCRIMPLGDSITFGIGSSGTEPGCGGPYDSGCGSYRPELFRLVAADQKRAITFVGTAAANGPNTVGGVAFPRAHQGHSGFTISGGGAGSLAGLVDNAIRTTNPNIILLMIGTNDINGNINVAQAPARLGALMDQITNDAPDALLAVAQIVPTRTTQTNTRVQAYNAAIPGLVEERAAAGKHVLLVDMFTPFVSNQNFALQLLTDDLHPNNAGFLVMGRTWYDAIETFLP